MRVSNVSALARLGLASGLLLAGTACDYSGEFLFADVADVPPILHIDGPDEGYLIPAAVETAEDLRASTIYAEVGAPLSSQPGGVTFTFRGTGRDVCVWVDPEMAFWNEKVGLGNSPQGNPWEYPDNIFDDGDLDLFVGLSVYYTGSPGEAMGDFVVSYEDSLGNEIPIELVSCSNRGYGGVSGSHAGRGAAEYCTVANTDLGISYTAALQTFSTPLDDDRLGFGFIVFDGSCETMRGLLSSTGLPAEECVVKGEGIEPAGTDFGPWFGFDPERAWAGSIEFEEHFCAEDVVTYCEAEAALMDDENVVCSWNDAGVDGGARCFCGDPQNSPEVGAG